MAEQRCRVCGCTWRAACPGSCYWVDPDLCSSCVGKAPRAPRAPRNLANELRLEAARIRPTTDGDTGKPGTFSQSPSTKVIALLLAAAQRIRELEDSRADPA